MNKSSSILPKLLSLYVGLFSFFACDCNDVDEFGKRVIVDIPINSSPNQTIFSVGDTIWWEANFSDQVNVVGVERRMNLENFDFFTDFVIAHIPLDPVLTESAVDIVSRTGTVTLISTDEVLYYGTKMVESDGRYKLKFGIVLRKPGVYSAAVNSLVSFDEVSHPALYACGRTRRENFSVQYTNSSTDRAAFDSLYIANLNNTEIIEASTFERYAQVGSITFMVTE